MAGRRSDWEGGGVAAEPEGGTATSKRVCSECGTAALGEERFCTRCGHQLGTQAEQVTEIPPGPAEQTAIVAAGPPLTLPAGRRGQRLTVAAGVVLCLLVAAFGVALFSWEQERGAHPRVSRQLVDARAQ